ncbi:cytochrome P450 [Glomus cerebriforme]|uniref:Cytochrome P450 n=1 Tax=Glomus cerebriforme TaxID=658196 RepID=A0A397SIA6_9GLOM|nr:cytochrome P450 [Glomus cerebriforme]
MLSTIISSFQTTDIFSLLIIFTIIYITQYYYHYFTRPNPLPGPFPLPLLGNAHQALGFEFNDWLTLMHKKYGDIFEIYMTGQRIIILSKIDLIENMNIPSTKTKYHNRFKITEGFAEYGLNGIGVSNNIEFKSWKFNRQFFTQAMMTPSFNHQAIEWTIELWQQMESHWNNLGENKTLNISKWMHRFTNDMIFRVSTGIKNNGGVTSYYNTLKLEENNNSLNEKEKEKVKKSEQFIQSIETFINGIMLFFMLNRFIRHYVPFIRDKANALLKNRDYLFDEINNIIKQRRIEIENTPVDKPLNNDDMLTSFITANTSRDINYEKHADADLLRPMTDREICANLLDAMIAGTDTTANTLCFAMYYLGHNPEVKQKLRQELDTVLGKDSTKPLTSKNIEELKYCDAVIKEVFRHMPVVFTIGRINNEDDKVGGYDWPEGTQFQMLTSAIMMSNDYWTNPERFDPDRFYKVEESDKYLLEKQHIKDAFIMWGGGIRMCPGRKLATIELKCLLSMIYRKYDIELKDMNAPLKYKAAFLTSCENLLVKVKPRKF